MSITEMNIKPNKKIIFLASTIFFLLIFSMGNLKASTDCDDLEGDAKDECEKLDKKAKVYEELIELKNKQQDTLSGQMESISKEQEKNRRDIAQEQKELADLDKKIAELERSIQEKEIDINNSKALLAMFIQTYYEYDQQGLLDLVLINKNFSETLSQSDYTEQSSAKITELLGNIERAKNEMTAEKEELNKKREESNIIKEKLMDKNSDLEISENQKQSLLTKTQGEEEKYKDLLANVEAQKKELFNFSEASNLAEINASVGKYPKPSNNLASTSWYFSQKDSRWGNKKIGNSSSLMKDYGCAVSCVSMVFRKIGSSIDPGKMCKEKIFYYDLIKWPGSWSPGISLTSSVSHGNIKWSKIDSEINDGNPVIVYIRKTNGGGGHYVVVTGKDSKDYIVHDPYFGPNLYLGTSKSLVGKIGTDSKVAVDQMIIYN